MSRPVPEVVRIGLRATLETAFRSSLGPRSAVLTFGVRFVRGSRGSKSGVTRGCGGGVKAIGGKVEMRAAEGRDGTGGGGVADRYRFALID